MEKQTSRSPAKAVPVLYGFNYARPGSGAPAKHRRAKPTRAEISRCINIWAAVYRLRDVDFDAVDLQIPSRTWAGRLPPSIERFE